MNNKVVFSALYNEPDDFLPYFIKNFLMFTRASEILLINLPPGRFIPLPPFDESGRVFLFNGTVDRYKLGHTLLFGHIESFDYAVKKIDHFDYFCSMASNSLFVRNFNFSSVFKDYSQPVVRQSYQIDDLPDIWWFSNIRRCTEFLTFIRDEMSMDNLRGNRIEGLFSAKENWAVLCENRSAVLRAAGLVPSDLNFPFEEIFPGSIFFNFGDGRMSTIGHKFNERRNFLHGNVMMSDILDPPVADHVCLMKWFDRSASNPRTFAVIDEWAVHNIKKISLDIQRKSPIALIKTFIFVDSMRHLLRNFLNFVPLTNAWPDITGGLFSEFKKSSIIADGKKFELVADLRSTSGLSASYFFFEESGDFVDIDIKLSYDNHTYVEVVCHRTEHKSPGQVIETRREGYVCISPFQAPKPCFFRVRFLIHESENIATVMSRPVIFCNGKYRIAPFIYDAINESYHEYYIRHEVVACDGDIWLGLPFFDGSKYACLIDIIYDELA